MTNRKNRVRMARIAAGAVFAAGVSLTAVGTAQAVTAGPAPTTAQQPDDCLPVIGCDDQGQTGGSSDGSSDGSTDGTPVGSTDGSTDGTTAGSTDGSSDGSSSGASAGASQGASDGSS